MEEDDQRHPLTPAQIHQLMSVIAGMDSVKEAGAGKKRFFLLPFPIYPCFKEQKPIVWK